MKRNFKFYFILFLITLKLSAFTFGGGYVIISLMKKEFVDREKWITEREMLDYTAIAQSAPGATAVNAAILLGSKVGGALGIFVSVLGTILPPLVLLTAISYVYQAFISIVEIKYIMLGLQAGVAAVVCDVICSLTVNIWKENKWLSVIIAAAVFVLIAVFSVNVIIVVGFCILFGIIIFGRKGKENGNT